MKVKVMFRTLMVVLSVLTFTNLALSQAPVVTYSEVMYHKLLPGHTVQEALAIEKDWKKIHQVQLNEKAITGWYVLNKQLSSNPDQQAYDYITIKTFTDMGHLENSYPDKDLEKAFGATYKAKWADLLKRTGGIQNGGKVEIWRNMDGVLTGKAPAPIWVIELMKVKNGLGNEYVALEQTFKKLHQERVNMNNIAGWTMAGLMYPAATEKGYEYATVNYYTSMKDMADGRYMEAFNKIMPGQDAQKLIDSAYKTRDIVRQEVYILLEYVAPAPVQAMK